MSKNNNPVNTGKAIGRALMTITEADRNHMHLEKLEEIADNFTDDEAAVVAKKLIEKYPDIVMAEFKDNYEKVLSIAQSFMTMAGGKLF